MAAKPKLSVVPEPFKIESGIAMPDSKHRSGLSAALKRLAQASVGDSIFIPGRRPIELSGYINNAGFKGGWYASRAVDGGCRVWKIAEPKARA